MSFEVFRLAILGAHSLLGAEIARLAVALGHEVSGFAGDARPAAAYAHEPWTHGVQWHTEDDLTALRACDRFACCAPSTPGEDTSQLRSRVTFLLTQCEGDVIVVAPRTLLDAQEWGELVASHAERSGRLVLLSPAETIWMPGYVELPEHSALDDSHVQRAELVAMAALRVMLEDERCGVLERAEIAHLGDAMMIQ